MKKVVTVMKVLNYANGKIFSKRFSMQMRFDYNRLSSNSSEFISLCFCPFVIVFNPS